MLTQKAPSSFSQRHKKMIFIQVCFRLLEFQDRCLFFA